MGCLHRQPEFVVSSVLAAIGRRIPFKGQCCGIGHFRYLKPAVLGAIRHSRFQLAAADAKYFIPANPSRDTGFSLRLGALA
jgi:Fe-S oxidoreductase